MCSVGPKAKQRAWLGAPTWVGGASLIAALVGAGCVGSESGLPVEAEPKATTISESPSASTEQFVEPGPAETEAPSSAETSPPTTTTTTLPPVTPEEVADDMRSVHASWSECLSALPTCDIETVASWRTGTQQELASQQAEQWNSLGYNARNVSTREIAVTDVEVDGTTATVMTCEVDGTIIFVPAAEGGNEQIVDDLWVSTEQTWTLSLEGDRWRASGITDTAQTVGEENEVCTSEE